jgi:hypothetical protein
MHGAQAIEQVQAVRHVNVGRSGFRKLKPRIRVAMCRGQYLLHIEEFLWCPYRWDASDAAKVTVSIMFSIPLVPMGRIRHMN